jgi:nucleoid DNA-binding protein
MNKSKFIEKISKKLDITKTEATKSLNSVITCIEEYMKENDELKFIGFGTFKAKNT